jgi:ectoine hydroxylase-related dioxygenase (phytanoyl-CoA dioxygenase family)
VGSSLDHAGAYQLMLTQVISIYPGEKAQGFQRDENAWDYFPFPADYQVQCNTLWALSDYTSEMGATRIVPGSQLPGGSNR